MKVKPEIELTADGSQTLRHPVLGEAYHSSNGAMAETSHVFIRSGLDYCTADPVNILEVGFGSGLNAYMTLRRSVETGRKVRYTAVELYPVEPETALGMEYAIDPLFRSLHQAEWGRDATPAEGFTIRKIERDLAGIKFDTIFDLVYFDAFAPDCQPELWTARVFSDIHTSMRKGGILVTYSARGEVKRNLRQAGFEVFRLPGAPGKRHMVRAVKI